MATDVDAILDEVVDRVGPKIVVGLPLGLGKPIGLVNALYDRVVQDPSLELEIITALSLNPPRAGSDLERRFLEPFAKRHFGTDPPRLRYADDLDRQALPDRIRVVEFYFRSGAALGNPLAQRNYISSNYTHVARDLVDRGVNLVLQQVAGGPEGDLSLSCNPDVTLELADRLRARPGHECVMIARIHPDLPFMQGDAVVPRDFFDHVLPASDPAPLFAVPREPVSIQDHAVGFHASALIEDGGTLQIGIGALSDALVHGLLMRDSNNGRYRELLTALAGMPRSASRTPRSTSRTPRSTSLIPQHLDPFEEGLYGASEMFMDGFMHLYRAGILSREVFDDEDVQEAANEGRWEDVGDRQGTGAVMDAAFFLGSRPFYDFLASLDSGERPRFRMSSVARINQLYGGNERLETLQRRRARFFNTCMKVTATGAAVSDGLKDYQMVSGVGGQYNFVAMAHAMRDGRSILMLRSTRRSGSGLSSNVIWEHPHATIPRHLRDVVVTEYGVADLRGRTDEECIRALISVMDARFQDELADRARDAGKLDPDWSIPPAARLNTPERLRAVLERREFPSFPFGSDFTPVEERLVGALGELKRLSSRKWALVGAALKGRPADYPDELERMGLDNPSGVRERLTARLLAYALGRSVTG